MSADASPDIASQMTAAVPGTPEPALLEDLVTANRILSDHGVLDAYGHISARDPGNPRYYWISRSKATLLGPVHFLTPSEIEYAKRTKPKDPDRAWQLWKQRAMKDS